MNALFASALVMSLLGSLHCAAMCGGLVGFVAGSGNGNASVLATYQLGRLVSYAALGIAAGWVGNSVDSVFRLAGVANAAALLAAVLMVGWGGSRLVVALGLRAEPVLSSKPKRQPGGQWFTSILHRFSGHSPLVRASVLGLLTGVLPCGWLYAFVLMAAGTGNALSGFTVMTAFWLGGVPALLGASVLLGRLAQVVGKRLPAVTAVVLMVAGLGTLATRTFVATPPEHAQDPTSCPLHPPMKSGSLETRP